MFRVDQAGVGSAEESRPFTPSTGWPGREATRTRAETRWRHPRQPRPMYRDVRERHDEPETFCCEINSEVPAALTGDSLLDVGRIPTAIRSGISDPSCQWHQPCPGNQRKRQPAEQGQAECVERTDHRHRCGWRSRATGMGCRVQTGDVQDIHSKYAGTRAAADWLGRHEFLRRAPDAGGSRSEKVPLAALVFMVGVRGFEPLAPASRRKWGVGRSQ